MEKLTLTRKEAAELLGISIGTVTQWVLEGRLKAYRVSDKPKSPYLFTKEDCQAALLASPVAPVREKKREREERLSYHMKEADKELDELLKIRTKGRRT